MTHCARRALHFPHRPIVFRMPARRCAACPVAASSPSPSGRSHAERTMKACPLLRHAERHGSHRAASVPTTAQPHSSANVAVALRVTRRPHAKRDAQPAPGAETLRLTSARANRSASVPLPRMASERRSHPLLPQPPAVKARVAATHASPRRGVPREIRSLYVLGNTNGAHVREKSAGGKPDRCNHLSTRELCPEFFFARWASNTSSGAWKAARP